MKPRSGRWPSAPTARPSRAPHGTTPCGCGMWVRDKSTRPERTGTCRGTLSMVTEMTLPSLVDEEVRRHFERAWREGRPEPIEQFLPPEQHPHYLATLEEL